MKILIVDDAGPNRTGLSSFCKIHGYEVLTAQNGLEAVDQFKAHAPDMILMDVMMPVMDGFEATREIKKLNNGRWVPILLITALDQEDNLKKGVESGADDYLTKPVNFTILGEKIKIMKRISAIQNKLQETADKMQVYHDRAEEEFDLATLILDRFSSSDRITEERVQHWILPAEKVGGDLIAIAKSPGNSLNVILADGTGHGLSAAISVVPICQIFYSMTSQGYPLSHIMAELNDRLNRLLPVGYFVAATAASIKWGDQSIEIWNGGAPSPIFIKKGGQTVQDWGKTRPALGILGKTQFNAQIEPFKLNEPGALVIYSDGFIDARDRVGETFGKKRLIDLLQAGPYQESFNCLKTAILEHLERESGRDDISLAVIECPINKEDSLLTESLKSPEINIKGGQWKYNLTISASEIRRVDLLPYLLTWLRQTGLSSYHCERLFIVISELFNNGLEHGILGLDSDLKLSSGFEGYLRLREKRLQELNTGQIEIQLERIHDETVDRLVIRMKDSGSGFDYLSVLKNKSSDINHPAGRGISLIKSLCKHVEYQGNGNEVRVEYSLN